jgi:tetratricopeptide (TPR) repeat protein
MKALEIDPNLPEARIALGWIAFSFDWDWNAAETEFKKAIELAPNNSEAHRGYAHLFSILGRSDEAIAEIRRARELDPLSLLTNALEGQFLFYAGRIDEARTRFHKTLEIDPDFWIAHIGLGRVYIFEGKYEEAIRELRKALSTAGRSSTEPITQLGYALARSGRQKEARQTLQELNSLSAKLYVPAYSFAMIHNGLGEKEEALRYLEKSLEEREVQITFIKIDRRWDDLGSEPRFVSLMHRVGFER